MSSTRFDVLVVGAGPAGSVAALVLARAGARVALVDKARFPRDKACGDFVGPRGLQALADLGVSEPDGLDVGDMIVVGPTGRRVVLPCFHGLSYPGRARAVTRVVLDDALRTAAVDAGATDIEGRADRPLWSFSRLDGFVVDGHEVRADLVIGADGATSHVAASTGLVDAIAGPVGLRGALLPRPTGRSPGHHPVGTDPVAGLPRIRLDLSRTRRGRQRRARPRNAGRPTVRCRCGARSCPPISTTWSTSDSSTGHRGPCPVDSEGGSRWAWSGPPRQREGCCWRVTPPDWSTRCRERASPRP